MADRLPSLRLGPETLGRFDAACAREWLSANGLGGFASGTASGANTRRYHGLLVAALRPPVDRRVMLSKIEEEVVVDGERALLSSNEFGDGTVHPRGHERLLGFELDGLVPVWRWRLGLASIEKRVWMEHGRNATWVLYRASGAAGPIRMTLTPLCAWRDFHAHARGPHADLRIEATGEEVRVGIGADPRTYRIRVSSGRFQSNPTWHWNFRHRAEAARGLDEIEDLLAPGCFEIELRPGEALTVVATTEEGPIDLDGPGALERERAREADLLARSRLAREPEFVRRLVLAADAFLVRRSVDWRSGWSVLAGYPWFEDWGRDTMIALPGLTLATGRPEIAKEVISTFARFVDGGLLPNRFPDAGTPPEYNAVDASLWFFEAVRATEAATEDAGFLGDLYPTLGEIMRRHLAGTRFGIRVEADGLLRAGEPGVQLTWMDAKVGDRVITPRIGKPVEVNALWVHALRTMADFARRLDRSEDARSFEALADRAGESFVRRFWFDGGGYLYDVVDGPEGDDPSLRPNQVFAASLPTSPLPESRRRAVLQVVARHLLTPFGLRSLAPGDPAYRGRYRGGPAERDGAYHQGTVWSWLLGPFAIAWARAFDDPEGARELLADAAANLFDHGLGTVSEVFDGDPPFRPEGCIAQAWGVGELLRAWVETAPPASATRPAREKTAVSSR